MMLACCVRAFSRVSAISKEINQCCQGFLRRGDFDLADFDLADFVLTDFVLRGVRVEPFGAGATSCALSA